MRLDLLGKYPIKTYDTFFISRTVEEFRKNNSNRKVIIFDKGYYDDDYLEKIIIKKEDNGND